MELRRTRSRALTGRCVRKLVSAAYMRFTRGAVATSPSNDHRTLAEIRRPVVVQPSSRTKGRPWQLRRRARACEDIKQSEYVLISWIRLRLPDRTADSDFRDEVLLLVERRGVGAP